MGGALISSLGVLGWASMPGIHPSIVSVQGWRMPGKDAGPTEWLWRRINSRVERRWRVRKWRPMRAKHYHSGDSWVFHSNSISSQTLSLSVFKKEDGSMSRAELLPQGLSLSMNSYFVILLPRQIHLLLNKERKERKESIALSICYWHGENLGSSRI